MSLHYLLDGYNILHQIPSWADGEVHQQRLRLIQYCEQERPLGSLKNKITIYFDGRPGRVKTDSTDQVTIIFTDQCSADEKIKEKVARSKFKKNFVVVTDDRAIQYATRAEGATILKVAEFLSKGNLKEDALKVQKAKPPKPISKTQEQDINEELKKLWVDKDQ